MTTPQEHANKIGALCTELNRAMTRASNDGLRVEVRTNVRECIGYEPVPTLVIKALLPLDPTENIA